MMIIFLPFTLFFAAWALFAIYLGIKTGDASAVAWCGLVLGEALTRR